MGYTDSIRASGSLFLSSYRTSMADDMIQYLTPDKLTALQAELRELKEGKIPNLAKRIDEARQMGDLSENAEYHAAREEMAWAQSRVNELKQILDSAELISGKTSGTTVGVGSAIKVRVKGLLKEYQIVGAQEADPGAGKISNESPLGMAFLGHKKGDTVEVKIPAGLQLYEILEIH